MSVVIKHTDIPGMEEYRRNLTKSSNISNVVTPKISFAQAASTDLGYSPDPTSKAKKKDSEKQKNNKNKK